MEVSETTQLILALAVVILAAKFAGSLARAMGQPRVFGELLAGVVLGPSLIDFLEYSSDPHLLLENIEVLAELGVMMLMFKIGLDVHFSELVAVGRMAAVGGVAGAMVPVLMAVPIVLAFDYETEAALFAGVTLAATAVSISAQTLLELNLLRTKEGSVFLATTLIDDMLAVLLLSFTVAIAVSEDGFSAGSLALIAIRMVLYVGVGGAIAWFVLPAILDRVAATNQAEQLLPSLGLVFALVFGWSAEAFGGLAAITGAFIAGVGISQASEIAKRQIEETANRITYAFLAPIFFISVGLLTDLGDLSADAIPLALALLTVAVVSKIGGSGVGLRLGGLDLGSSFRVGVCMVSRGEVGLIIVTLGLSEGVFDDMLFSSLFLVVLLTTVLTPPMVRWAFRK